MKLRLTILMLSLCALPGCGDGKQPHPGTLGVGEATPQLQGKLMSGDYVQLSDYAGKVVLINVWATWCKPCVKELPELVRLAHAHADEGLVVLGVNVDTPNAHRQVERMVDKFGIDYPVVLDPNGRSLSAWEIRGYPTSFLVDREGKLRWRRDGIIRENDGELSGQLEAAL